MQTRSLLHCLLVPCFLLPLAAGCSSDSDHPKDSSVEKVKPDHGPGQDQLAADAPTKRTVQFSFLDFTLGGSFVEGVKVCIKEDSSIACDTTVGTGLGSNAKVTIPTGKDLTVVATKTGYITWNIRIGKNDTGTEYGLYGFPTSIESTLTTDVGKTVDLSKAILIVSARKGKSIALGATVTVTPASGTGPVYSGNQGWPDSSLSSVQGFGWAWYVNQDEDTYSVTAKDQSGTACDVAGGWQGTDKTTASIKLSGATISSLGFSCP
jgi:hypothetical protein